MSLALRFEKHQNAQGLQQGRPLRVNDSGFRSVRRSTNRRYEYQSFRFTRGARRVFHNECERSDTRSYFIAPQAPASAVAL